jgi:hypothetical protein
MHLCCYEKKLFNLKFKTPPKQLLASLMLDFALPVWLTLFLMPVDIGEGASGGKSI